MKENNQLNGKVKEKKKLNNVRWPYPSLKNC